MTAQFAALLAQVGVPLVPLGSMTRSEVAATKPPTAEDAFRLAPELVAARFDTLTATAERGDARFRDEITKHHDCLLVAVLSKGSDDFEALQ
ncbi:hypothetical protein [Streptomyces sp. WAC01526]|uniref:hypothetical protein n=1 Tax=Streptomyces sp. WAC01526 TaxID=2588709 RepID=UPI0021CCC321|nr:hypothetical protein [Streptomyces sp. WAC01526]